MFEETDSEFNSRLLDSTFTYKYRRCKDTGQNDVLRERARTHIEVIFCLSWTQSLRKYRPRSELLCWTLVMGVL